MLHATNVKIEVDGDDVELARFTDLTKGVQDLLSAVERSITKLSRPKAHWSVLSEPGVYLTAVPNGVSDEALRRIADEAWELLSAAHRHFEQYGTMRGLSVGESERKALAKIVAPLKDDATSLTVAIEPREPIEFIAPEEVKRSITLAFASYVEFSAIDGLIDLVSTRGGSPYFAVKDNNTQRPVKVFCSEEQLRAALTAFGGMVEVSGMVRYRADGVPISIRDVQNVHVYPEDVPDIEQFAGSLPGLLGDLSLDEYMDQLRGRDGS